MSVQRRLNVGFAALFVLFLTLLSVQFGVGAHLHAEHDALVGRITAAQAANDRVLQRMTDAETGVRGFQLTGERLFLEPYETGWSDAFSSLDDVAANTRDDEVRNLVTRERDAIRSWLDEYALPVIDAGSTGSDHDRAARAKVLFDDLRLVNDAVELAISTEERSALSRGSAAQRLLYWAAALLVVAILSIGYLVVRTVRGQLLTPLEHVGRTIRRLAAGDHSARAEPVGATELRPVIEALNDLAAQTETLLAGEQARVARAGLRQAVAAELQEMREPTDTSRRIAGLIGMAVGADSVHCELGMPGSVQVKIHWPSDAADLPASTVAELTAGSAGEPRIRPGGEFSVTIRADPADPECEPGYLLVTRAGAAWADAEHRLLTGVTLEIERALKQLTLQHHQARLISELRRLDQRKDVFIQTVTHELRTPLTSILGYTEMFAEDGGDSLSPLQKRAVSAILRNAHRLHETIGDLVLLDRPDAHAGVTTEPVDLAAVAITVHGELDNAARAKDLAVSFEAGDAWVCGDRTQLQRAMRKLMENAIKFTPPGGRVDCHLTADDRSVVLSVTDTGIGIPADDVPGLFTPFHRAGNAMDQAVQGPGLGLAIVRDIVRDHGGTIAVQSVVGRGSTFTITLPAALAPTPIPV
ncbi:ATP-binding protein [Actinoplanes sp. GCM10030250]|uniref:ATP-binding protein n=1 Tax=Actinoplanes sp. GCM10030250 TaxID=3273376 RepID=UPI00361B9533